MTNEQPDNAGKPDQEPGTGRELASTTTASQAEAEDHANRLPQEKELREAIDNWRGAVTAEAKAQGKADGDLLKLQKAQDTYDCSKKQLEDALNETAQREKDVDDLLEKITNETLEIEEPDITLFQGVSATFRAKSKYELNEHLVYLFWETAGLPILGGQYTDTITVDTSKVGPGDYDIDVTLRPVPKRGWKPPAESAPGSASTSGS
jgi:hypothetical protein